MARIAIGTEYFHATDMVAVEVLQDKQHDGGWFGKQGRKTSEIYFVLLFFEMGKFYY